jgi:hypothetical protein
VTQRSDAAAESAAAEVVPRGLRIACGLVLLEALALVGVAGLLVVKTIDQSAGSVGRALFGAALALLAAAVLALGARSLLRLRPAARSPVVVVQVLAVPVSYSLAFQAGRVGYGGPMFVVALAVLYLLFTPPVRAVLDREIG